MGKKYLFLAILFVITIYQLFYLLTTIKITAEFEELEPFPNHLPVYYKGFRLGHTIKVYPDKDYLTTMVDLRIKNTGVHLPQNTTAILKRKDKKDYVELIYPDSPYLATLKNNSVIEGSVGLNFENFLQDQATSGGLDEIKNNVNNTVKSAGDTFDALTDMLGVLTGILEDVRPTINSSVKNLEISTENIAKVSDSLKNSVDKGYIDNSLLNFQETSKNLVITTKNFGGFSESLNNQSSILTNCLLKKLNVLVSNVNQIVVGIGETLKKRFGGFRLIFGRTIDCESK